MSNETTEKEAVITNKMLEDVKKKVASVTSKWAMEVASRMSATKEWKEFNNAPISPENVKNIAKGVIKGQRHRVLFVREACKLIQEHKEMSKGVNVEISEALSTHGEKTN